MVAGAIAANGFPAQFGLERDTPYARWVRGEGLDVIDAHSVTDLRAVDLKPWARRGGRGVFIHHEATPVSSDCYVCEIPPGGSLAPQRHLYEEIVLVLDGRGSTSVSNDHGVSTTFEWKAGVLFSVPLNATYRHFNGSGQKAVRFVAVTTAPMIINALRDFDFVFASRYAFDDHGLDAGAAQADSARVVDALDCPLLSAAPLGVGGHRYLRAGGSGLSGLVTQLPPATYGKAYAQGAGAHTIVLAGAGYSLLWPEGAERTRWRWREGSLMVVPNGWRQQHFNPSGSPARYVTLQPEVALLRNAQGIPRAWISTRLGGTQIDYADEAVEIRASFAAALSEAGLGSRMCAADAAETS